PCKLPVLPSFPTRRSSDLPVGFAVPACCQARGALLPHHFTLARTLPSEDDRAAGGIFLLHFPSARAAQALPGTVPCGARTFLGALPGGRATRLPGRLRRRHCRTAPAAALRPSGVQHSEGFVQAGRSILERRPQPTLLPMTSPPRQGRLRSLFAHHGRRLFLAGLALAYWIALAGFALPDGER